MRSLICPKCGLKNKGNYCNHCGTFLVDDRYVDDKHAQEQILNANKQRATFGQIALKWIAAFVVAAVILTIIGDMVSSPKNNNTQSVSKKESTNATTQTKETFTNDNYAKILSDPDKYKGSPIEITGKIFTEVEENENITAVQIWANPKNSEGHFIVYHNDTGLGLESNDFIKAIGEVSGKVEGENMLGGKVMAASIDASEIEKISSAEVLAPTENTVDVNQPQGQHGIVVNVEKIEFAKEETRVFIDVSNESESKANFHSYSAKLTQGSSQFEPENNFEADYPEVQTELLPNIESSGIITFKPIDYTANECTLYFEAGSDDYNLDFKPYIFKVTWE